MKNIFKVGLKYIEEKTIKITNTKINEKNFWSWTKIYARKDDKNYKNKNKMNSKYVI